MKVKFIPDEPVNIKLHAGMSPIGEVSPYREAEIRGNTAEQVEEIKEKSSEEEYDIYDNKKNSSSSSSKSSSLTEDVDREAKIMRTNNSMLDAQFAEDM